LAGCSRREEKQKKVQPQKIPTKELDEAHALASQHSTNSSLVTQVDVQLIQGNRRLLGSVRPRFSFPTAHNQHQPKAILCTFWSSCTYNLEKNKQMSNKEEETRDRQIE
jgi:hypothetical protein